MRHVPLVASLIHLLMAGCSDAKTSTATEVDVTLPVDQLGRDVPESRDLGTVEISQVVTASAPECRPRIQLIYVIPGRIELGESTHVEVQTQNLVGETHVEFEVDNETEHHTEIELAELGSCALGSTACRELTCRGLDDLTDRDLADGRRVGEGRVAVTVEDDECRDTEHVTVECVAPADEGARCGNGVLDPGEECDRDAGLEDPAIQDCADDCLTLARCGNRIVERAEACDDGNLVDRDGCGSDCSPSPLPHCGDHLLDDGEICDGSAGLVAPEVQVCAEDCTIAAICGNGHAEPLEACDDGNGVPGDGCELDCSQTPVPSCGNGSLDESETCDDGNDVNGDGCDSHCDQEPRGFCARYPGAWICELIERLRNRP